MHYFYLYSFWVCKSCIRFLLVLFNNNNFKINHNINNANDFSWEFEKSWKWDGKREKKKITLNARKKDNQMLKCWEHCFQNAKDHIFRSLFSNKTDGLIVCLILTFFARNFYCFCLEWKDMVTHHSVYRVALCYYCEIHTLHIQTEFSFYPKCCCCFYCAVVHVLMSVCMRAYVCKCVCIVVLCIYI